MDNTFICFDTESAQGHAGPEFFEELLEISIVNHCGSTIYYHRLKPTRLRRWDTKIHHITPAMVKDEPRIAQERSAIQQVFDNARYIIGFSLPDDYRAISKVGIKVADDKKSIELRHLYWYCLGRHRDIPFYSGPGLSACATELKVDIDPAGVHTATGDTLVTLGLFKALYKLFAESEGLQPAADDDTATLEQHIALMLKRIEEAKYDYDRRRAAGYIHVVTHHEGGYCFVASESNEPLAVDPLKPSTTVLVLPVKARRRAIYELEARYSRRRSKANRKVFMLNATDLRTIIEYANEYDGQEQMYQRLTGLNRGGLMPKG